MAADRFLSMLSLCRKAGKLEAGAMASVGAVRAGRAVLLILAADASGNTKKDIGNCAAYYKVPLIEGYNMETLGRAMGKELISAVAVCDAGFGRELLKLGANNFGGDV